MKKHILIASSLFCLAAAPALAQTTTTEQTTVVQKKTGAGAVGGAGAGAVAGAVVAGPVGAAVGAVTGAVVGHAAEPPTEVRTYVTRQNVPAVTYGQPIVVGQPIAGDVSWLDVTGYPKYRWAYLDGRRVVIDTDTHAVVAVY